jgi:hypothetical protein
MEELRKIDSIESSLHYKTGTIVLENGLATINIAKGINSSRLKKPVISWKMCGVI